MPKAAKSAAPGKQKRAAGVSENGREQTSVARPEAAARAWPTVNKLKGTAMRFEMRHKVPSGPVGGMGRKTNLTRSS